MIVITTPTGAIGRQLLARILDAGEPVRVIVRDPVRLPESVQARAEIVPGSHRDPGVLASAFKGADRVFWLVPPDSSQPGGATRYYLDFTRPACEAITSQGVRQVVAVSTLGHGYQGPAGLLSAALAMDELIESTGVSYRALALPFFMENLLRQAQGIRDQDTIRMAIQAERALPAVAVRDIAAATAALLLDGSWTGQESVPVVSPDDLTPAGMAGVISDVLGRPVRYQQVPVEAYQTMMLQHGASEAMARDAAAMVRAQNAGIYDAEPHPPNAPTSFRQWCEDTLRPAIGA